MSSKGDRLKTTKCQEVYAAFLRDLRKKKEAAAAESEGIAESEEELRDRIQRTRTSTKIYLSMLPKGDLTKADRRRQESASKSIEEEFDKTLDRLV